MAITILASAIVGSTTGTLVLPAINSTGAKGLLLFLAQMQDDTTTDVTDNKGTGWHRLWHAAAGGAQGSFEVWTRPILPADAGSGHIITATNQGEDTTAYVVAFDSDSGLGNPTWAVLAAQFPAEHLSGSATSTSTIGASAFPIDVSGGATEVAFATVLRHKAGIGTDVVSSVNSSYLIDKQLSHVDSVNPLAAFAWKNSTAADVPTWTFSVSRGNVSDLTGVWLLHESGDAPVPIPIVSETTRTSLAACVRTKDNAAWGKWKFSGRLRSYSVLDNMLVLSIERGDTVFVETIDIGPVPGTRFLDCEILTADMDAPVLATGVTTWTLPFSITDDLDHPLTIVNTATGNAIATIARTLANKISATGDFTATDVAIGLLYPTQWELTPLFVTTQEAAGETIALTDGRLQIRHVEFNFTATGEFTVTVIPNTDDESQAYTYTYDGATDAAKGAYRVPVFGQNTKARITVGGTSHRPFAISNFTWTGYLSQITKRV